MSQEDVGWVDFMSGFSLRRCPLLSPRDRNSSANWIAGANQELKRKLEKNASPAAAAAAGSGGVGGRGRSGQRYWDQNSYTED